MKRFTIFGDIITNDNERMSHDDITPSQFKEFIDGLDANEPCEILISSCGGSVLGCISICNMIRSAIGDGHEITCHVVGIAASSASVIACAGSKLVIDSNAVIMIHLPYTCDVCGNKNELRKEAQTLEQLERALVEIYQSKFDLNKDEISQLLTAETWILADEVADYNLACTVNKVETCAMKYAAKIKQRINGFNNRARIEELFKMNENEQIEENLSAFFEAQPEVNADVIETVEEVKAEVENEPTPDEIIEALKAEIDSLKNELDECKRQLTECDAPDEEVEKRVSGMQSKMQMKINDLKKDFTNQIENKNKELSDATAKISDLERKLETSTREFSATKSALADKENALANLTASVMKPGANVSWRDMTGKQFTDWIDRGLYKHN